MGLPVIILDYERWGNVPFSGRDSEGVVRAAEFRAKMLSSAETQKVFILEPDLITPTF
jgi:hypothetical protein